MAVGCHDRGRLRLRRSEALRPNEGGEYCRAIVAVRVCVNKVVSGADSPIRQYSKPAPC